MSRRSLVGSAPIVLVCSLLGACSDTFVEHYDTLRAARDDRIFERGWLPDVLPESTHSLRVSGDVDINTAEGEFSARGIDIDSFTAGLAPMPLGRDVPETVVARAAELQKHGYVARSYAHEQHTWIFLCSSDSERCEYHGWPES
jgi:hypothetical protein